MLGVPLDADSPAVRRGLNRLDDAVFGRDGGDTGSKCLVHADRLVVAAVAVAEVLRIQDLRKLGFGQDAQRVVRASSIRRGGGGVAQWRTSLYGDIEDEPSAQRDVQRLAAPADA